MKLHEYLLLQVAMTTTWSLVTMEETEISSGTNPSSESRKILMPGISTQEDDEYWCTSMKAPDEESYITSFEAVPDKNWAHHMMVFSCDEPGNTDASWPCAGGGCKGKSNIMFAWAYHAEPTILPKDVGFLVGGTKVKYIALQVHYKLKVPEKDHSGIRMTITTTRPKNVAGILIMAASSLHVIPPHQEKYHIDISCQFKGHTEIYPFAFRVHAHSMADVITGYQYNTSWHLLKKGNPRWPQAFYPASESFVIKPHDILVARCTYNSMDKSNAVAIGPAHTDEMCNFYMMYYTDPDLGSSFYQCYGDQYEDLVKNIPEGSDIPPPSNPLLEDIAQGHHKGVHEVVGWPSGAPELGQVSGVSTDLAGNVHVFHRGSRTWEKDSFDLTNVFKQQKDGPIRENTILTFDSSGKLIDQWGADMFYLPHGLHIDKKDNVWITDVAMHQVMRFPVGKHEADLVIGEEFVPGKGSDHFCKPTSVATLRNGQFYVSDGYCNHRIVKFSADGKMLKEWGDDSSSSAADGFPPPSTFTLPHSISLLEDDGILCVADRSNNRIQCFDLNGNFLRQMHSPEINGQVFAVALSSVDGALYVVNGRDNYHPETEIEGFTFSPVTGRLALTWGPNSGTLKQPHDLAVSPDGKSIYVVEIGPNKIWKFAIVDEKGLHQSMKKNGRPSTVDNNSDDNSEKMLEQGDSDHFGTSLIIGGLLIVPVIIVMLVTFFLRLKKGAKGKEPGYAKLHQTDLDDEDEQGFV